MARILGVDLSLTATGVALFDGKQGPHRLIRTKSSDHLEVRKDFIVRSILRYAKKSRASFVVLERLNSGPSNQDNRPAQVMGAVTRELWLAGIPYDEVASNTIKKFVTGNGRADKADMVEAIAKDVDLSMYPKSLRDNVADAIGIARWGHTFSHQLHEGF
jgi:crossover junction endodeoxyribonuclease RuvC